MVTKNTSDASGTRTAADFSSTIKESAQQIWLAGLGAFAKAQEEGSKVFDTLVKEGVSMQRKTQASADEKVAQASSKLASMASDLSAKATGQWDKLETIFEGRVSKALQQLGVPTHKDVDALSARIDELERKLSVRSTKPGAARRAPTKTVPAAVKRKSARKPA